MDRRAPPATTPGERQVGARLAAIGLANAGLCALLASRYPLVAGLADPRGGWEGIADPSGVSLIYHTAIYLGLTVLYILALRLLLPSPCVPRTAAAISGRSLRLIIVLIWLACCGILLMVAPGGESHDIFDYVFRGRMMAEFGGNPLTETPGQYKTAAFFRYVAWHGHVDTYGPLWEMASAATAAAVREALNAAGIWGSALPSCPKSPDSCRILIGYLTGYRLVAIGLTSLSACLIVGMVRRNRPQLVTAALAAWLWSPLLLISTAAGAHNDALMILFLLLVLWLLQRRLWLPALLALALAAHVKLTALIVAPAVGLWLVRRLGWRRTLALGAAAIAASLAVSWLLYAPFGGWSTLPRMLRERAAFLANSPWRVLQSYLITWRGWSAESARTLAVNLSGALFAASALFASFWMLDFRPVRWKSIPAPDWSDDRLLWRVAAVVSLLYLLIGSFWFQGWYVVWVLAPVALMPDTLPARWLLPWLGFGALAANVVAAFALAFAPTPQEKLGAFVLIVATTWVPIFLAALWHLGLLSTRARRGAE